MTEKDKNQFSCKLTTKELQNRKKTVLLSLKEQLLARKEFKNGFAFVFPDTDKMIDELIEFIKTERTCCDFLIFELLIKGDKCVIELKLTGKEGVKDFITEEIGL